MICSKRGGKKEKKKKKLLTAESSGVDDKQPRLSVTLRRTEATGSTGTKTKSEIFLNWFCKSKQKCDKLYAVRVKNKKQKPHVKCSFFHAHAHKTQCNPTLEYHSG